MADVAGAELEPSADDADDIAYEIRCGRPAGSGAPGKPTVARAAEDDD